MSILPYEDEVICVLLHTYLWREFKARLAVRDIARDMVTRSWIVGRMPDETARQIHSSYGVGGMCRCIARLSHSPHPGADMRRAWTTEEASAVRQPEFLFSGRVSRSKIPHASARSYCPQVPRHGHRTPGRRYAPASQALGTVARSASMWRGISTPGA